MNEVFLQNYGLTYLQNHRLSDTPRCSTLEEEHQTDDGDKGGNSRDNENGSHIRALFPPQDARGVHAEGVPEQEYTMRVPRAMKKARHRQRLPTYWKSSTWRITAQSC